MQTNELIGLVVVGLVGCILVAGFLPVLNETVDPDTTFTNNGGLYKMDKINATDDFILEWEYTAPTQVTVNDEVIQLTQGSYPLTVFFNETLMIRVAWNDNIAVFETDHDTGAFTLMTAGVGSENNMTVTNVDGTLTITNGTDTKERTNSNGMIASKDGAYIMKNSSEQVYLTGDTEFYASGYTYRALGVANSSFVGIFKGTIDDGITVISQVPATYTMSNESQTYTQVTGSYKDLYKYTGFAFTLSDGENNGNVSYSQIIVPISVNAEKTIHADANTASILSMIPFILIVGIVIMFVSVVLVRRYV